MPEFGGRGQSPPHTISLSDGKHQGQVTQGLCKSNEASVMVRDLTLDNTLFSS